MSDLQTEVPRDRHGLDISSRRHVQVPSRCLIGLPPLGRAELDPVVEALEELLALIVRRALDSQQVDDVFLHVTDPFTADDAPEIVRTYVRIA